MTLQPDAAPSLPRALTTYPDRPGAPLSEILLDRVRIEPFNAVCTAIFVLAIAHTFMAAWFTRRSHRVQLDHDRQSRAAGRPLTPSVVAEVLNFFGEVEVVFGLWALVLLVAMVGYAGWHTATHYFNDTITFTEPLFVVVIMAMAATRPIIVVAESALRKVAAAGGGTPAAWWASILVVAPLLGSLITEAAAMTIAAVLLGRQFYDLQPSTRLKYATLGLLFVNVSIGGTLTHFAAAPVLMVANPWNWDTPFMLAHFGWRVLIAILASTGVYFFAFRRELAALASRPSAPEVDMPEDDEAAPGTLIPVPPWVIVVHLGFMVWTVVTAHYPVLFVGGFLFFLGFVKATSACQSRLELKAPLLVGFFLGGLVIHGGLQGWWIAPILGRLSAEPLFVSSTVLTAFNDNALITYLATLVPNLGDHLKMAVVEGAVAGGGLTVIANAPNPAGQALLSRFFDNAITPIGLFLGALVPTLIAVIAFRVL
jgi:Putative Na+/H+ antiporter